MVCCIRLWVHTDKCDSLVLCETHLPHVPPTSSVQEGGYSLQHTPLVSQTTRENNHSDTGIHMLPPPIPTLSPFTHPPHHITLLTTTLVCVTGCEVDQRHQWYVSSRHCCTLTWPAPIHHLRYCITLHKTTEETTRPFPLILGK